MSPTLMMLSDGAERFFWRLTTVADDFGRFEAVPEALRASCFPLAKEGSFKTRTVAAWFEELRSCGLVTTYDSNGHHLGFFTTWEKYQRTRATESKYPAPTPDNICQQALSDSPVVEVVNGIGIEVGNGVGDAAPPPRSKSTNEKDFMVALRENPAYAGIDIDREANKARAWLLPRPGRQFTRGFFVNWLNKIDKPVSSSSDGHMVFGPKTAGNLAAAEAFIRRGN